MTSSKTQVQETVNEVLNSEQPESYTCIERKVALKDIY